MLSHPFSLWRFSPRSLLQWRISNRAIKTIMKRIQREEVRSYPKADIDRRRRDVRFVPIADIPPLHSITSSTMESSPDGRARPRAFAVFRLMTSSNLVDCITGNSAGLVPFRILPT